MGCASKPMKVLLVSQYFEPETLPRGMTLAAGLVKAGHDVAVLTGFPNYPQGEVFAGYKQSAFFKEVVDGVTIYRVPTYVSHDSNAIRRALNYLSFMFSSFMFGIFRVPKFDVAYVYHPPITTCLSAAVICMFRRRPFVCDIQDLWPDSVSSTGMLNNKRLLGVLDRACNFVYRRASHLVAISNGVKEELISRGVPSEKVSVIHNWCDESKILHPEPLDRAVESHSQEILQKKFNIMFAGNMGEAQNLGKVLDAATIVSSANSEIQFVFVGAGTNVSELKKRVVEEKIKNVEFLPQVPSAQIGSLLKSSNVLLVHLKRDRLFDITVPSKTQAYMATGKPILMAVPGNASEIVSESGCGILAESDNPESIATACLKFASMSEDALFKMGEAASKSYKDRFSIEVGVKRFDALLSGLAV